MRVTFNNEHEITKKYLSKKGTQIKMKAAWNISRNHVFRLFFPLFDL